MISPEHRGHEEAVEDNHADGADGCGFPHPPGREAVPDQESNERQPENTAFFRIFSVSDPIL